MKTILFITILLVANISSALYDSKEQLFSALNSVGVDRVVYLGAQVQAEEAKILNLNTSNDYGKNISQFRYSKQLQRVEALDYIFNDGSITESWSGKQPAEAYAINDVVLCYRMSDQSAFYYIKYTGKYVGCYTMPIKISELVELLKK